MGPVALAGASLAIAAIGTGYGVYASQRAQSQAAQQYRDQQAAAKQQQAQQQAMLEKQQTDSATLMASQTQAQQEDYAAQQKVKQDALTNAQGQIPIIQGQLNDSLIKSEQAAQTAMNPQLEARLNALGLLQSGALPEAQAKYQSQLDAQRQQDLTQYGVNAQNAIQSQALNYAGSDAATLQNNLNTTLTNQQSNLSNQFNSQDIAYQNNVAQQQYLANLQAANTAAQQASANQYINFGGQVAGGALNYFGKNNSIPTSSAPSSQSYFGPSGSSLSSTGSGIIGSQGGTYDPISGTYNPSIGALEYYRKYGG